MVQEDGNYHAATLPVAVTVLSDSLDDTGSNLRSDEEDPGDKSNNNNNNNNKSVNPNKEYYDSFGLTTGTGPNQSYWGRFHDATAEVVGEADSSPFIPVTTATAHLDDRQIRQAFIRKVYMILSVQLLATFAVCAVMAWNASILRFCTGPGFALYYLNMVVMFGTICALQAYKVLRMAKQATCFFDPYLVHHTLTHTPMMLCSAPVSHQLYLARYLYYEHGVSDRNRHRPVRAVGAGWIDRGSGLHHGHRFHRFDIIYPPKQMGFLLYGRFFRRHALDHGPVELLWAHLWPGAGFRLRPVGLGPLFGLHHLRYLYDCGATGF
jgi:hypothetical protein